MNNKLFVLDTQNVCVKTWDLTTNEVTLILDYKDNVGDYAPPYRAINTLGINDGHVLVAHGVNTMAVDISSLGFGTAYETSREIVTKTLNTIALGETDLVTHTSDMKVEKTISYAESSPWESSDITHQSPMKAHLYVENGFGIEIMAVDSQSSQHAINVIFDKIYKYAVGKTL